MTAGETPVPLADKPLLAAMMRDYIAEMVAFVPGVDPKAPYPDLDLYWSKPHERFPFWLNADDAKAGFALIRREREIRRCQVAEFFVTRPFRRRGLGLTLARHLIARFPGPWVITQREINAGAIAFWHRVLDGFVAYEDTTTHTDAVRHQQTFDYPEPGSS